MNILGQSKHLALFPLTPFPPLSQCISSLTYLELPPKEDVNQWCMGFGAFSNSTPTRLSCKSTWFLEHNHFGHEVYVLNSQINHPQKIRCTKSLSFTCTQMKGKTIYDDFQYILKVLVSRYPCHLITIGKGYGLHTSYYRLLNLKDASHLKVSIEVKEKTMRSPIL
jgi:hypothetical protein